MSDLQGGDAIAREQVIWKRFAHHPQDVDAVLGLPDGSPVTWFRGPDGSLLINSEQAF